MATPPLERVKALLAALPREDQEALNRFLGDILFTPEEVAARERPIATLEARSKAGRTVTYTFRNEWIRCGKASCKCASGAFHGPYTYKYWREDGRLRKKYVGKSGGSQAGRAERGPRSTAPTRLGGTRAAGRARRSSAASSGDPTPPA